MDTSNRIQIQYISPTLVREAHRHFFNLGFGFDRSEFKTDRLDQYVTELNETIVAAYLGYTDFVEMEENQNDNPR